MPVSAFGWHQRWVASVVLGRASVCGIASLRARSVCGAASLRARSIGGGASLRARSVCENVPLRARSVCGVASLRVRSVCGVASLRERPSKKCVLPVLRSCLRAKKSGVALLRSAFCQF